MKTNWLVFFSVMLAPVLLTILAVLLGSNSDSSRASPGIAFIGGIVAGIVCGVMLGWQVGKTMPMRIVLSLAFAYIMAVVCVGMSCFGCMVSGFQLQFR